MEPQSTPVNPVWPFPCGLQDWEHTPPAVQAYVHTLHHALTQLRERVDALEARLKADSTTSQRPPSADSPAKKPRQRPPMSHKAGGTPGHPGHRHAFVLPTPVQEVRPARCAGGHTTLALTRPYHTHQVLEVPPSTRAGTHWVRHQSWCPDCGRWSKAPIPAEPATGYGPRGSAVRGELAGTYGTGRRMVQTFCASVPGVPISWGTIQKGLDRLPHAIAPYSLMIAAPARHAPVNSLEETPWYCEPTLAWLWAMTSAHVACSMSHPRRSTEACAALIDAWTGILVSDGDGVYRTWVERRQTCLAHLIRTARSVAERRNAALAACGTWALAALPRRCPMATAPPTGGEWRAWYARVCHLIDQYQDRPDDAGRFARRLVRELDALWVFLAQHGVEPTNHRAERA